MIIPRDYQLYAANSIFDYFAENEHPGNPIVAMPTGTGKSIVIALFIQLALKRYWNTKIMGLTHVKELIEQNFGKLIELWPEAPSGIYSAGLKRKESFYPITFGGIASVVKPKVLELFGKVDLLLIDECHLISPNDETNYQKVIAFLKLVNPSLKVIGFTATPYRMGQGMLTDDGIFTDICCDMVSMESFNWFLSQAYLLPLIPRPTETFLDASEVRIRGGEYKQDELQEAFNQDPLTRAAVEETITWGMEQNRQKWLVFASGIEHVINVHREYVRQGIKATFVHSKMTDKERDYNIAAFRAGEYTAMVNNGILTTGFDDPSIDLISIKTATNSTNKWVQMLGRGTRPFWMPGFDLTTLTGRKNSIFESPKHDCLVLDFARNTKNLGPINDPVLPKAKGKGTGEAPVKLCPPDDGGCGCYVHASVRICPIESGGCGYVFPKYLKIHQQASTDALIAKNKEPDPVVDFKVIKVTYQTHQKMGRPDSLKVTYYCEGHRSFNEFICFEHNGTARGLSIQWWKKRDLAGYVPVSTEEALEHVENLRVPTYIRVVMNSKYGEVKNYCYTEGGFTDGQTTNIPS